jgi:hypothetical protein
MEIFYAIPGSKYGEGIFLTEYKDQMQLIAGRAGKEGTNYQKWAFPQNKDRKPTEKAIPVSVNLGDRSTAISILEKILSELRGSHGGDETYIPF